MTISDLVTKYVKDRERCLRPDYNETQLRTDYLDPMFELLGWDIKNNASKPFNEREVIVEESLRGAITENAKKPDYTFRLFAERKFFLEAKKPSVPIDVHDGSAKQVRRYGFTAKLKVSVLSNFEYLIIYDCSTKVEVSDNYQKARVKVYHYTDYINNFSEIASLLSQQAVYSGSFDEQWKSIEDKINHFSVDDLFLQQINGWRISLGSEIYRYQPGISEDLLNDCVQSYINRIIFLRVCEDRNQEVYETLLQFANSSDFLALVEKFKQADHKYNSGLFNQYLSDELIGNVSSVLWIIIRQLYYPDSPYSFAVFSSDILGRIYEIFLSEKLSVIRNDITLVKKPEHIDRDIVATPISIIHDILNQTIKPVCQGKNSEEILSIRTADIACGSGAFLIESYQLLNDLLIDFFLAHDRQQLIQQGPETWRLPFLLKKRLLLSCIYGVDKDFNAVEAAKFGLLLKLLEGEDSLSLPTLLPILPDLSQNIHFGNTLVEFSDVRHITQPNNINPYNYGATRYDVIVGNPPYMKSEDMKSFTPYELPVYKTKYTSAYKQFDKYFLFIERGLELLKPGGFLGYIVPAKFFKVGSGLKLRELLQSNGYLSSIVSFGANQIFKDKTTYTCLLTLKKSNQTSFNFTEVNSLREWNTAPLNEIAFHQESNDQLDNKCWVLVPPPLKQAFNKILNFSLPLSAVIGEDKISNGIQTSLNSVYIIPRFTIDDQFIIFEKDGQTWKIEKGIARPYYNTPNRLTEKQEFQTYRYLKSNSFVLFPYYRDGNRVVLIPETTLQASFPEAFKYLKHYETKLRNRDVTPPIENNDWYKFGRSQHLDNWDSSKKIVVGVLSTGGKYPIDQHGTIVSSGGTAGYCILSHDSMSPYSIYYLQALLNSKYVEWFASLYGEVFRGGYIARGTKVLDRLPIRKIDFNDPIEKMQHDKIAEIQLSLIEKQTIISNQGNNPRVLTPLIREFGILKTELDQALELLFDLGKDDILIPTTIL